MIFFVILNEVKESEFAVLIDIQILSLRLE